MKWTITWHLRRERSIWNLTEKGDELLKRGEYQKAVEFYEKALETDPAYVPALCGRGALLSFFGQKQKAIESFETALRINSRYIPALKKLAWNLNSVKRYDDAINCCNSLLEVEPRCAEAWSIKGYSLYKQGHYGESLDCCHRAKEIDPATVNLYEKDAANKEKRDAERRQNAQLQSEILQELQSIKSVGFDSEIAKIRDKLEHSDKVIEVKKEWDALKEEIGERERQEKEGIQRENDEREKAIQLFTDVKNESQKLMRKGVIIKTEFDLFPYLIEKKLFGEVGKKAQEIHDYFQSRESEYNALTKELNNLSAIPSGLKMLIDSGDYQQALNFLTIRKKVCSFVENRLSVLNTNGFEKEVQSIYRLIDDPSQIFSVEQELTNLEEQIRLRDKKSEAVDALSRVLYLIDTLKNDGFVVNNDIAEKISRIKDLILKKQFDLIKQEISSLELDLTETTSHFEKAKQIIQHINSNQARQLFQRGEYQHAIKYCNTLQKQMDTLKSQLSMAERYTHIPVFIKKVLDDNDYDMINDALDSIQKIVSEGKPKLSVSLNERDYVLNASHQVTMKITNSGDIHARDIRLFFSNDVTVKMIPRISRIAAGESKIIDFAIIPNISGDIPVEITIESEYGPENKHYSDIDQKWIHASERSPPLKNIPNNKPSADQMPLEKPVILREYEFFGGGIRIKVSVKNNSEAALLNSRLELEFDEHILDLQRHEPENYRRQNNMVFLDNINPHADRSLSLYLEPLTCTTSGTDVHCYVRFTYTNGKTDHIEMEPLKIKVVCPIFDTEHPVNIGQIKDLLTKLPLQSNIFYNYPKNMDVSEVMNICNQTIQERDIHWVTTLKRGKNYESWFHGITKVHDKEFLIGCFIFGETYRIKIFTAGNDQNDITGLLADLKRNLRSEFNKHGNINQITIKDSVFVRSTVSSSLLSRCNDDGSCSGDITILDSVITGSEIGAEKTPLNNKSD